VVAIPVHEIVRGMRHFVEKRVDPLCPILPEHQVDVQRDLHHIPVSLLTTR